MSPHRAQDRRRVLINEGSRQRHQRGSQRVLHYPKCPFRTARTSTTPVATIRGAMAHRIRVFSGCKMQGQRARDGRAAQQELLSAKHLAGSPPVLGARRRRGFLSPASVSPGPGRWAIPPGPPIKDRDPAPSGRAARSMAASCRADRRSNRESRRPTRTGSACRRVSAPGVRWQDVSRSGGQPQPPDASVFPPQLGAPCREGL